jgi:hypothetical protein
MDASLVAEIIAPRDGSLPMPVVFKRFAVGDDRGGRRITGAIAERATGRARAAV